MQKFEYEYSSVICHACKEKNKDETFPISQEIQNIDSNQGSSPLDCSRIYNALGSNDGCANDIMSLHCLKKIGFGEKGPSFVLNQRALDQFFKPP